MPDCLVVDDSRVVRRLARGMLERFGFTVREAEDGAAALRACQAARPDLILLDRNMPVMDGLECLHALRRDFGEACPPVMFCTTEAALPRIMEALEAGAREYIMKPFDEAILADKLAVMGFAPSGGAA